MTTPVCDFIKKYNEKATVRCHMPGHKGKGETERWDLTEIEGADSLYEAEGILAESEGNAGALFGAYTFYSTEGSSHAIRAMLHLTAVYAQSTGRSPKIAAGRNAHKSFVTAAALLDVAVDWLTAEKGSYLSCPLTANEVKSYLDGVAVLPTAVYLTSPDYLGNTVDVAAIARVCHQKGVLLLVDNAHGAYLKFLPVSRHPMDLGADACCDSAHKTLHALTGAAYLHVSHGAPEVFWRRAKSSLSLFGSTSPSYLILASLDALNLRLANGYREALAAHLSALEDVKADLVQKGYRFVGDEPMKLTIDAKAYGYTGDDMAAHLLEQGIVSEFHDPDLLVLMPTPDLTEGEFARLTNALVCLPKRAAIMEASPIFSLPEAVLSPRVALLADEERIAVEEAEGRVLTSLNVSCPPAVPVVVSGERIDQNAMAAFAYYGITHCFVMKETK
ncbi:MAG: aminotransferase class V-fold PLP-dependent enzyme [Clostridia bacterium]|nr:aminotransferase class V-fold PLP-dependent enzyme [Clostridia bacterium]